MILVGSTFFSQAPTLDGYGSPVAEEDVYIPLPVATQPGDYMAVSWWAQYAEAVDPRLTGIDFYFRAPNHLGAYGPVGDLSDVQLRFGGGIGYVIFGALVVVRGAAPVSGNGGGEGDFSNSVYSGGPAVAFAFTHDGSPDNFLLPFTGEGWEDIGGASGDVDNSVAMRASIAVDAAGELELTNPVEAAGGVKWMCGFTFMEEAVAASSVQPPNMRVGFL